MTNIVIDTETTGDNPKRCGVTQIGAQFVDENASPILGPNGKPLKFNEYLYPPKELDINMEAIRASGIDMRQWLLADSEEAVAKRFEEFTYSVEGEHTFVAFNAQFDYWMLWYVQKRTGRKFNYFQPEPDEDKGWKKQPWLCVLQLSRKLIKKRNKFNPDGIENHQLATVCRYFNRPHINAHDALYDAENTALILGDLLRL